VRKRNLIGRVAETIVLPNGGLREIGEREIYESRRIAGKAAVVDVAI
jgi:hypothetical protein